MSSSVAFRETLVVTRAKICLALGVPEGEVADIHVQCAMSGIRGGLCLVIVWSAGDEAEAHWELIEVDVAGRASRVPMPVMNPTRVDLFRGPNGEPWVAARGELGGVRREAIGSFDALHGPRLFRPFTSDAVEWVGVVRGRLVRLLPNRSHRRLARLTLTPLADRGSIVSVVEPRVPYPTDGAIDALERVVVLCRTGTDMVWRAHDDDGRVAFIDSLEVGSASVLRPLALGPDAASFIGASGDAIALVTATPKALPEYQEVVRLADSGAIVHAIGRPTRHPAGGWMAMFATGGADGPTTGNGLIAWQSHRVVASLASVEDGYVDARGQPLRGTKGRVLRAAAISSPTSLDLLFSARDGQRDPPVTRLSLAWH